MSIWSPLWSSGQSFWLQIQRSRVRFPALPDFLSSSVSGTGSTHPREINWGATWIKISGSGPEKQRLTAVGIRCADRVTTLYPQKLALTSPTGGGHSVGIVRSRTKATEFSLVILSIYIVQHGSQKIWSLYIGLWARSNILKKKKALTARLHGITLSNSLRNVCSFDFSQSLTAPGLSEMSVL
jgi:hypothetical protein